MLPLLFLYASLVNNVRDLIASHNLAAAEQQVRAYQAQNGATVEVAVASSWVARGALDAKDYARADAWATETRKLTDALLKTRKLDADRSLPIATGASIEVHAQSMAARGDRAEAVAWLREQARAFVGTSIAERIRKNVNLLSLEGKPAPALEASEWLGTKPPTLASVKGHPVLLFFWAHWCIDCKGEAPVIANLERTFAHEGLIVIAPTKLYGYVARGEEAPPAAEKQYIEQVRQQYYAAIPSMAAPLSAANFENYGASTTPTLVLVDRAGTVRLYHPGAMSEADLAARIRSALR